MLLNRTRCLCYALSSSKDTVKIIEIFCMTSNIEKHKDGKDGMKIIHANEIESSLPIISWFLLMWIQLEINISRILKIFKIQVDVIQKMNMLLNRIIQIFF